MLKRFKLATLVAVMLGTSALAAEAGPIQGGFSITGNFLPVVGTTGVKTTLALATGLDFIDFFGSTATPGVAGIVNVNSATGDFAPLAGTSGTIKDFSFSGAGSVMFPTPSILSFQQFPTGGVSFDLQTVNVLLQNSSFLVLTGTGLFHMNGFTATAGTFDFSGNGSQSSFSLSSSQGAAIPEPASMLALAVGLLGSGGYLRRRMRRSAQVRA